MTANYPPTSPLLFPDASAKRPWNGYEAIFFVFIMICFFGFTPPALFGGGDADGPISAQGDTISQVVFAGFFIVALLTRLEGAKPWLPPSMAVMLAWCFVSLAWAVAPDIAIRRVVVLAIYSVVIFKFVSKLGAVSAFRILCWALAANTVLDLLAVILLPNAIFADPETGERVWRGLQGDKNSAAPIAAIGALVFAYRMMTASSANEKVGWFVLAIAAIVFLKGTGSKTSFGLLPVAAVVGWVLSFCFRTSIGSRIVALAFVVGAVLAWWRGPYLYEQFELLLQDPDAFTGRTQIWDVVIQYWQDHFWLGSGYGSFWSLGEISPIYNYADNWLETVPNAHNGYLDIGVQTGAIGLSIAVYAAFISPMRRVASEPLAEGSRWLLASVIVFAVFQNFLEASLFNRLAPLWVLLCCFIGMCVSIGRERQVALVE